jgi:hypothetical protein
MPTYGVSGLFGRLGRRRHPRPERAHPGQVADDGRDFLYEVVKDYAGGK